MLRSSRPYDATALQSCISHDNNSAFRSGGILRNCRRDPPFEQAKQTVAIRNPWYSKLQAAADQMPWLSPGSVSVSNVAEKGSGHHGGATRATTARGAKVWARSRPGAQTTAWPCNTIATAPHGGATGFEYREGTRPPTLAGRLIR